MSESSESEYEYNDSEDEDDNKNKSSKKTSPTKKEKNENSNNEEVSSLDFNRTLFSWQCPSGGNVQSRLKDDIWLDVDSNLSRPAISEFDKFDKAFSGVCLGIVKGIRFGDARLTFSSSAILKLISSTQIDINDVKTMIGFGREEIERLGEIISGIDPPEFRMEAIPQPRQRSDVHGGDLLVVSKLREMVAADEDSNQIWKASGSTHIPESHELNLTSINLFGAHIKWDTTVAVEKLDSRSPRATALYGKDGCKSILEKEHDGLLATFHRTNYVDYFTEELSCTGVQYRSPPRSHGRKGHRELTSAPRDFVDSHRRYWHQLQQSIVFKKMPQGLCVRLNGSTGI